MASVSLVFLTSLTQGHKKLAGTSAGSDRFRLLISDGRHLNSFAMLATQLNNQVTSGELCDFTVVQITRYITSMVTNSDKGERYVGLSCLDHKPCTEQGCTDMEYELPCWVSVLVSCSRLIPCRLTLHIIPLSNRHRSQPNPLRNIVVPQEVNIPAKFCYIMVTRLWRANI